MCGPRANASEAYSIGPLAMDVTLLRDLIPRYLKTCQSLRSGVLGTSHQKVVAPISNPRTIGCRTCTPALVAINPIIEGKLAAPACETRNTKPGDNNLVRSRRLIGQLGLHTQCGGLNLPGKKS